jgi:hypothetical protein
MEGTMYDDEEIVSERTTHFRDKDVYDKAVKTFIEEVNSDLHSFCDRRWTRLMYSWNRYSDSREHNCLECKREFNLGPVVIDSLWNAICVSASASFRTQMCKQCMERFLGRSIRNDEQPEYLWNVWRRRAVNE